MLLLAVPPPPCRPLLGSLVCLLDQNPARIRPGQEAVHGDTRPRAGIRPGRAAVHCDARSRKQAQGGVRAHTAELGDTSAMGCRAMGWRSRGRSRSEKKHWIIDRRDPYFSGVEEKKNSSTSVSHTVGVRSIACMIPPEGELIVGLVSYLTEMILDLCFGSDSVFDLQWLH